MRANQVALTVLFSFALAYTASAYEDPDAPADWTYNGHSVDASVTEEEDWSIEWTGTLDESADFSNFVVEGIPFIGYPWATGSFCVGIVKIKSHAYNPAE
ncbi:hypothetical protein K8I61_09240 [bacterium]|nr:hypothetical protein [bacterium]